MVFLSYSYREVARGPPARPSAQKPVLSAKAPSSGCGPSSLEAAGPSVIPCRLGDLPQELRSLPPDMALAGGSAFPNIRPYGAVPLTWPPGAVPFAPTPFPNQRMPQLAHYNYGQATGVLPPTAPPQGPRSGHILPSRGGTPVPPNPQNTFQMPPQGYMPAPWQQAPSSTVPSQIGPQAVARPSLPRHQTPMPSGQFPHPVGQQMQTGLPQSASAPQIPPGIQYSAPQPGQGLSSQTPVAAFSGQIQQPIHPGQFRPMMAGQGQPQPSPTHYNWPPQTQSQTGLPVQPGPQSQRAPLPVQAQGQPHFGSPNQIYPGQLPQNQPLTHMSHILPPFPSSQPQQMPGSFLNTNQQAGAPQTTTQIPFSQNAPMPFTYNPSNQPQIPPGSALPYNVPAGAPHNQHGMGQQPVNTQFNPMFQPVRPQNQNLSQTIPSSSSGPAVPVMDNPNPPAFDGILTPSPSQRLPQNQAALVGHEPHGAVNPDVLNNKLDKLSISSQGEALKAGVMPESGLHPSQPANGHPQPVLTQPVENENMAGNGMQGLKPLASENGGTNSTTQQNNDQQESLKRDLFGDLDPLWSVNKT